MRKLSIRHARHLRVLSRRWRRRFIFMAGGLIVGAGAIGLAYFADKAQAAFRDMLSISPELAFLITPIGFGIAVYVTNTFFPHTGGSGIPQVMAARRLKEPSQRATFVGPRAAVGKLVMTLFGLLIGASIGREGPTVQIGASIMFMIGRLSPNRQPGLILAGAAAGVAAAFNTPLAGIVFAIEEMSRSFEVRASGLIIGAIILAGMTSLAVFGNYAYFGTSAATLHAPTDWLTIPLCGVIGGLGGGLFSRLLVAAAMGLSGKGGGWIRSHPVIFGVGCGLVVALCGFVSHGAIYGTGYEQAKMVVQDQGTLPLLYAPLKFLATVASSVSGLPGGLFSPSLSVGAGIGADIARFFPHTPAGAVALLGMVGYFAGVVQAPITAFVIVSEMTDNHNLLIPLMATALIADAVSKLISRDGVYHMLAHKFYRVHGHHMHHGMPADAPAKA
jgi:H+/Cl- antiporter ClcA